MQTKKLIFDAFELGERYGRHAAVGEIEEHLRGLYQQSASVEDFGARVLAWSRSIDRPLDR